MSGQGLQLVAAALLAATVAACPPKPQGAGDAGPPAGCMAECPTAPPGCSRTSIDPGSCADGACSKPPPACHYARAADAGDVTCPATLAGRCIAP